MAPNPDVEDSQVFEPDVPVEDFQLDSPGASQDLYSPPRPHFEQQHPGNYVTGKVNYIEALEPAAEQFSNVSRVNETQIVALEPMSVHRQTQATQQDSVVEDTQFATLVPGTQDEFEAALDDEREPLEQVDLIDADLLSPNSKRVIEQGTVAPVSRALHDDVSTLLISRPKDDLADLKKEFKFGAAAKPIVGQFSRSVGKSINDQPIEVPKKVIEMPAASHSSTNSEYSSANSSTS